MAKIVYCEKISCKHCDGIVCGCKILNFSDSVKQGLDRQVVCGNFEERQEAELPEMEEGNA